MRIILFFLIYNLCFGSNYEFKAADSVNYFIAKSEVEIKNNNTDLGLAYLKKANLLLASSKSNEVYKNSVYKKASVQANIINNKIIATSKLINILAIAVVSILSLLSISLYKNNLLRTNANLILQEKNLELEKEKIKVENASRARSEFLSTVSHELRTPLNAITGITHLLINENPKENQIEYLNSLKFSGNYLLNFINDILEINRIESKNIPIENIPCDLKKQLVNIQSTFKEITQENNNVFEIEIDSNLPDSIICDPTKLSQILINLINNSLKFTKNGIVKLTVKVDRKTENSILINFVVSDNGIGIPAEKQSEIFESFSQGSIEINRKYGGTGLGLAIVKNLIELLGGTIKLESSVGIGSKFYFSLPFEINNIIYTEQTKTEIKGNSLINKKILLVEDNKINQMITRKMLENRGMICEIVENGEDSIAKLKEKHLFDLVLMDVHLPGINGTIATQEIRNFNKTIPIIGLTAISLDENREMLISYGMTDVVTKPFDPEKFYQVLNEHLA